MFNKHLLGMQSNKWCKVSYDGIHDTSKYSDTSSPSLTDCRLANYYYHFSDADKVRMHTYGKYFKNNNTNKYRFGLHFASPEISGEKWT